MNCFHRQCLFTLAGTYVLASNLPSFILDALINLPHFLISVRGGLLPVTPAKVVTTDQLPLVTQRQKVDAKTHEKPIFHSPGHAEVEPAVAVTAESQGEGSNPGDE